jgi:metal-dependent amidase/aminoacylase/carboxypeptidase family protein
VVNEKALEIVTSWEACVPRSVDMSRFRRTAFAVLNVPRDNKIPDGWRLKGVTREMELGTLEELETLHTAVSAERVSGQYATRDTEYATHYADSIDCNASSISRVVRPPPGIPFPTTSMETLDAILGIVRRA